MGGRRARKKQKAPAPVTGGRGREGRARRTESGQTRLESQEEAIKCFFLNNLKRVLLMVY